MRSAHDMAKDIKGGKIAFVNEVQETPINEISAYHIADGKMTDDYLRLSYVVSPKIDPFDYANLSRTIAHINGRYMADEAAIVVALPRAAPRKVRPISKAERLPIVHILIPGDFRSPPVGAAPSRFSYGWANIDAGLNGIGLELPAFDQTKARSVRLNIRVHDPLWPDRDLLNVTISQMTGAQKTVWLDTRDRILRADDPIYITLSSDDPHFDGAMLDEAKITLLFKPYQMAMVEHVKDRLEQARDNLAFLVEEHPNTRLYPLYERFERDITDVLRVDPDNQVARAYWAEKNPEQVSQDFVHAKPPQGVPLWAFRQVETLKLYQSFIDWWIDHRQAKNGELGGGLSDDTDFVNQWVPLASMGVTPDRYIRSQKAF